MAKPYGKAIWQSHMAKPYGKAMWQGHVAAAAAAVAAAAAYVLRWNYETFSGFLTLKNDMLKNQKYVF